MNITLNEREIEFLKQYAQVYEEEREKDSTRDPIIVVEDTEEIVSYEGDTVRYSWNGESYANIEELKEALNENDFCEDEIKIVLHDLEEYGTAYEGEINQHTVIVKYNPVAYFLTRKEAEKYCKYQSHNLRRPRVYSRYVGYGNGGDLECLIKLLLRIGQQLEEGKK